MFAIVIVILSSLLILGFILVTFSNVWRVPPQLVKKREAANKNIAKVYAEDLLKLIQIETISIREDENQDKFYAFQEQLEEQFKYIHQTCEKIDFNGSLLFKWKGLDESIAPIMLMSHYDVPEAPGEWRYHPFEGKITGGIVWGRGTAGGKGNLFCIFTAIEELMQEGYEPRGDIYFMSTCTKEWRGEGAQMIANHFRHKEIHFDLILGEGGMIVNKLLQGIEGRFATIGILEKGKAHVKFTARAKNTYEIEKSTDKESGKHSPIIRLAAFIQHIQNENPFKFEFNPIVAEMYRRSMPNMSTRMKYIFANLCLFKPFLEHFLPRISPESLPMTKTVCTFKTQQASVEIEGIEQEAFVTANVEFISQEEMENHLELMTAIAARYDLETKVSSRRNPSGIFDYKNKAFRKIEEALANIYPDVTPIPWITSEQTECQLFDEICTNTIRFTPLELTEEQKIRIYTTDEHIHTATLVTGVEFFKTLIECWV